MLFSRRQSLFLHKPNFFWVAKIKKLIPIFLFMDFKSLVESRYSVRSYTPQPVSEEALRYVLDCARLAPSAVNFQPWHFYVVTTADMRSRLTACYQREWFVTAPCYVIITVRHDEEWVRKADNKPHGDIDVAIAAEHLCLAAAEQGLGTCWVCNFDADLCKQILNLPVNEAPVVILPLGHPAPEAECKPKNRKAADDVVTRL